MLVVDVCENLQARGTFNLLKPYKKTRQSDRSIGLDVWADVAEMRGTMLIRRSAAQGEEQSPETEQAARVANASQRASSAAQAMCDVLNLAAARWSPRVLKQATTFPPREHVIEHLDSFAEAIAGSSADDERSRAAIARFRAACADWMPGPEAPPDVQQAARSLLSELGCPEPTEGWDAFEGPASASEK